MRKRAPLEEIPKYGVEEERYDSGKEIQQVAADCQDLIKYIQVLSKVEVADIDGVSVPVLRPAEDINDQDVETRRTWDPARGVYEKLVGLRAQFGRLVRDTYDMEDDPLVKIDDRQIEGLVDTLKERIGGIEISLFTILLQANLAELDRTQLALIARHYRQMSIDEKYQLARSFPHNTAGDEHVIAKAKFFLDRERSWLLRQEYLHVLGEKKAYGPLLEVMKEDIETTGVLVLPKYLRAIPSLNNLSIQDLGSVASEYVQFFSEIFPLVGASGQYIVEKSILDFFIYNEQSEVLKSILFDTNVPSEFVQTKLGEYFFSEKRITVVADDIIDRGINFEPSFVKAFVEGFVEGLIQAQDFERLIRIVRSGRFELSWGKILVFLFEQEMSISETDFLELCITILKKIDFGLVVKKSDRETILQKILSYRERIGEQQMRAVCEHISESRARQTYLLMGYALETRNFHIMRNLIKQAWRSGQGKIEETQEIIDILFTHRRVHELLDILNVLTNDDMQMDVINRLMGDGKYKKELADFYQGCISNEKKMDKYGPLLEGYFIREEEFAIFFQILVRLQRMGTLRSRYVIHVVEQLLPYKKEILTDSECQRSIRFWFSSSRIGSEESSNIAPMLSQFMLDVS